MPLDENPELLRYSPMLREAGDLDAVAPTAEGNIKADVCIVGGGYLGLWTAIRLLQAEPSLSVVIVEADLCGSGASGRNSGMALAWWSKFEALAAACGLDEALRLCRESAQAIEAVGAFCRTHDKDIEFRRTGWIWGATAARQEGRWTSVVEALAAA